MRCLWQSSLRVLARSEEQKNAKSRPQTVSVAAIVNPEFIVGVRKKLALDQKEAAEIFGGGVNAFSRYENGKTKPSLALVKLLKVLERHPDLLEEVKSA